MTGWLLAVLGALGALVWGMVKADLEDAKVCRWLARKLVYRAALRLPRGERARWREEMIRDLLDLQGRVAPLFWALSVYWKAGSWGRMRGMPSRWQALTARLRATWQRLQDLPTARARARAQQLQVASIHQAQAVQATAVAPDAGLIAVSRTRSSGSATLGSRPGVWFSLPAPDQMYADPDFLAWLREQRRAFEDDLDRKIAEYRRARDRFLGG